MQREQWRVQSQVYIIRSMESSVLLSRSNAAERRRQKLQEWWVGPDNSVSIYPLPLGNKLFGGLREGYLGSLLESVSYDDPFALSTISCGDIFRMKSLW